MTFNVGERVKYRIDCNAVIQATVIGYTYYDSHPFYHIMEDNGKIHLDVRGIQKND